MAGLPKDLLAARLFYLVTYCDGFRSVGIIERGRRGGKRMCAITHEKSKTGGLRLF